MHAQRTPHVLVFWRPDMQRFSAFLTGVAPASAAVNAAAQMTLLPDLSKLLDIAPGFAAVSGGL